jgi:hypothetical protein
MYHLHVKRIELVGFSYIVAADMDHLHVKRIELVSFSYIVIENYYSSIVGVLLYLAIYIYISI